MKQYIGVWILVFIGFVAIISTAFNNEHSSRSAGPVVGRFQIVAPGSNAAYDTTTGRMCWLYDPIGDGSPKIPLCQNLK
jgi:hypothetical protein